MIPTRVNDAIAGMAQAAGITDAWSTTIVLGVLLHPGTARDKLAPLGVILPEGFAANIGAAPHSDVMNEARSAIVSALVDRFGPKARPRTEGQGADIIHIAGPDVMVGSHLRQRCGWCGAMLVDQDLDRVAVLEADADRPFPTWPVGALIGQVGGDSAGSARWVVEHEDGSALPLECCAMADPEVTA